MVRPEMLRRPLMMPTTPVRPTPVTIYRPPAAADRPADIGDDLVDAEFTEPRFDDARRAHHVVEDFRMGVEILAPFGDLGVEFGDAIDHRHWGVRSSLFWVSVAVPIHDVNLSMVLLKRFAFTGMRLGGVDGSE